MAIDTKQVKKHSGTEKPRQPTINKVQRKHPIIKTLLLAIAGIVFVTGAVIYGNHTQWQTAQKVQKLVIKLKSNLLSKQIKSNKLRHKRMLNPITQGLAAYLAKTIC